MISQTGHRCITKNPAVLGGEPIIDGTRTPVRAVVELWRSGVPVEEITSRLPHLKLSQVFDALSYFSDHEDEINSYVAANQVPPDKIHPLVKDL